MLQLTTALQYTPPDHPDHEGIPALTDSISRIIKGSQASILSVRLLWYRQKANGSPG